MLINSSHKRWFLSTVVLGVLALAVHGWLDRRTPGGLTGGSPAGLWYGLGGMALLVYAGLLAARRKVPRWRWLGSRKVWLKGHIWLGLLSTVFLLCHSGFRWGGPLERLLWLLFSVTLTSGIAGLLLQQLVPRLLTTQLPSEAPYDQIPHLCGVLKRKADLLMKTIAAVEPAVTAPGLDASALDVCAKVQIQEFHEHHVRPFLTTAYRRSSFLADPLQAQAAFVRLRALPGFVPLKNEVAQLERLCDERRQLAEQERLFLWLHGWLLLHVPVAIALLVLGAAHALVALYY